YGQGRSSRKPRQAKAHDGTLADAMTEAQQALAMKESAKSNMLEDEYDKTKPAELSFSDATHAKLVLTEGKYHQVKRMMGYFGNKVIELH
ncbi:16S rRNA pseudouridine(516) synthase, partial [Mycobacterium tuberculosis]|nr:16S rRNA pseudouridine(516) synthase [Mycobacterium tuberculosis]